MHNVIQTTESHEGHIVLYQIFIYILKKQKTILWRSKDHDLQKYLPMNYFFLHFRFSWAKQNRQLQISQLTYWSVNSFGKSIVKFKTLSLSVGKKYILLINMFCLRLSK